MSDPNDKHRTRQFVLIGVAGVVVLALAGAGMFFFDSGPEKKRTKPITVKMSSPGSVSDRESWEAKSAAQMKANESALNEMKNLVKQQGDDNKRLTEKLEKLEKDKGNADGKSAAAESKGESILSDPLPKGKSGGVLDPRSPSQLSGAQGGSSPASGSELNKPINATAPSREIEIIRFNKSGTAPAKDAQSSGGADGQGGKMEVLGFPVDEAARKFSFTKGKGPDSTKQIEFIPAGTFVRVAMLNGVDAPTGGQAESNPLPVALHVIDPANLPSKFKLDIRDCRVVASMWGDLSQERALGKAQTLSCILGDGQSIEMQLKGHLIGEDGKVGIRGRLVSKQGQVLANAALAGIADGIGKAFNQAATVTSVSPLGQTSAIDTSKIGQAALGSGIARSATALEQYYLRAADKLYPVIETDGGRIVELLVTKGVVYTGSAEVSENYRGLLKRAGANSRGSEDD